MEKINVEQIVSICIHRKTKNLYITYKEEYKSFWFKNRPEGYYEFSINSMSFSYDLLSIDYLTKNYVVEGRIVYDKPHINVYMSNKDNFTKYFETVNDLDAFMNTKEIKSITFIEN